MAAAPAAPKAERNEAAGEAGRAQGRAAPAASRQTGARDQDADCVGAGGHREAAVSDTQWLDAVRQAMATHRKEPAPVEAASKPARTSGCARVLRASRPPCSHCRRRLPAAPAPVAAPIALAPPPPPRRRRNAAAPMPIDHPVPPGAIPDPAEVAAVGSDRHHSRIRRWIAKIPLMGNVIDNGLE